MKIFTCTGPVDLEREVVETDHDMCDNCKSKVINAMQERIEESRPFIKYRDRKDPSEEIDDVSFRLLVLA
jgi:transposase